MNSWVEKRHHLRQWMHFKCTIINLKLIYLDDWCLNRISLVFTKKKKTQTYFPYPIKVVKIERVINEQWSLKRKIEIYDCGALFSVHRNRPVCAYDKSMSWRHTFVECVYAFAVTQMDKCSNAWELNHRNYNLRGENKCSMIISKINS